MMGERMPEMVRLPAIEEVLNAFGYTTNAYVADRPRDARYVALYWEPAGDEARFDDGMLSANGRWPAYLAYVRHPRMMMILGDHVVWRQLGNSNEFASHYLVLDRQTGRGGVLPIEEARIILRAQWVDDSWAEAQAMINKSLLHVRGVADRLFQTPTPPIDIKAVFEEQDRLIRVMVQVLDSMKAEGN